MADYDWRKAFPEEVPTIDPPQMVEHLRDMARNSAGQYAADLLRQAALFIESTTRLLTPLQ